MDRRLAPNRKIGTLTLRNIWIRLALRGIHFTDSYSRLNALYRAPDPWDLKSPRETFRFSETNRLIDQAFGRPRKLLEIGCGEGHQSAFLQQQCETLYGIDVADRAVERARKRLPGCTFEVATLSSSQIVKQQAPFDLVVAAEVLYYINDLDEALSLMEQSGRACFVTYYLKMDARLRPLIATRCQLQSADFEYEGTRWLAHWWKGRS